MNEEYAHRYAELYRRHWWWRAREAVVVDALRRRAPKGGWQSALDVGCGDGLLFGVLERFAARVEGVEPSPALSARSDPRIHRVPFDAAFEPGRKFSLVLMLDVLEHLPAPVDALRQVTRLLAPGGTLLVTVPAFRQLWTSHDDLNHHVTRYTKSSLRRECDAVGLALREMRYFFQWTVPAKLAVRAVEQLRSSAQPPRLPSVPPRPLNAVLYWLSRGEERTIGRLGMPVGSSLLAVAEGSDARAGGAGDASLIANER